MPPWAYAAVGAGGVMSLLLMIFVVKALVTGVGEPAVASDASREAALKTAQAENRAPLETASGAPAPERTAREPEPAAEPPPERTARAPASSGAALSTAQIVARCEPSVALIKGSVSSGTGFVIKPGIVATNAHVIEDELIGALEVRFPGAPQGKQGPLSAQLLYEDRKRDVAFLAVPTSLSTLELAPNMRSRRGKTSR